jgi:hypothetical protein
MLSPIIMPTNPSMKKISAWYSLAAIVLLSGCATSQSLSNADRSRIKTVTLNPKIEAVPLRYYAFGRGLQSVPLSNSEGGQTTTVLSINNGGDPSLSAGKATMDFMAMQGITIENILHDEFVREWNDRRIFLMVDKDGDAEITLRIWSYTLGIPSALSPELRPGLGVEALIKDKTGNVIWRKRSVVSPLDSSFPTHTVDAMEENPDLFKEVCAMEAQTLVKDLLNDLQKQ